MKVTMTAKLKLLTTPEQFQTLRRTQLAYREALNYVSRYAFAHGKKSNQQWLQRECYDEIRVRFGLPAQMACNVPRQVGATYKGLWTKARKNAEQRKAGLTKKRYKGLDEAPHYVSPTLTYNYHRDFSLKEEQHVSILTLGGRVIVPYTGYDRHVALIAHGAQIGAAKLWYDKPKKRFYTSQACPKCGYTCERNRPNKGLLFECQNCHYTLHADLIGARNVALRTVLIRQDWMSTGVLSVRPGDTPPDTSDREAKAARLARYAELRWSLDASPSPGRGRGN